MFTVTRKRRARGEGSSELLHRYNERITGQICWINRENDLEIWNRIIGKFNWLKLR